MIHNVHDHDATSDSITADAIADNANGTAAAARVAVVTGAAQGIGLATARQLHALGYSVVATDIQHTDNFEFGRYYQCDVSDEGSVAKVMAAVESEYGRLDVLANVAGIVLVKPFHEVSWEEYRHVVDVNLGGTFLMCKHAIPIMKATGGGSMVCMASVSGHVGQTDHALYGATKGAIISMVRALAWELAPYHIRVNSISPGSVDTAMLRGDISIEAGRLGTPFEQVKAEREAEQALGRWADPAEIAEAVCFLVGSSSSFITGTDLLVDGGWVAR